MPVNHILGRVPLMRTYLEGSSATTIPFSLARYKDRHFKCFKYGTADRRGSEGAGSTLFDDDVSSAGCFSKMGISTDFARVGALASNQALFGVDSEEGDGQTDIEENFFR